MRSPLHLVGIMVALLLGLLAGFFIVLNVQFSDVFGAAERIQTFIVVMVVYSMMGLLLGVFAGARRRMWLWLLAGPGVLITIPFLFGEPRLIYLPMMYIVLTVTSTYAGLYTGAAVARWRKRSNLQP